MRKMDIAYLGILFGTWLVLLIECIFIPCAIYVMLAWGILTCICLIFILRDYVVTYEFVREDHTVPYEERSHRV